MSEVRAPAILIVEDDPMVAYILQRFVRDLATDYDVLHATSGAEALALIARREPPLVFTDYNMPGMNGLQLTQAIKESFPHTVIAMVTAYPALAQQAFEQGADYFLVKPTSRDQIDQVIRAALISA